MARGWESKAVADQMEEAVPAPSTRGLRQDGYEISPAVRARRERLEYLRLSRSRTLSQLENATRPVHREMLQRTLRAIEKEMEELN